VSRKRLSVAIIGAGGLARAMALALGRSGRARVRLASRRPAAAKAAARGAHGVDAVRRIEDAIDGAAIVILAVPDRAIATTARLLVPMRASWRGIVVLHAAGAYGPELLAALGARGASTGVLHPLAVLGADGRGPLSGAFARIEGGPASRREARRLCSLCGLVPLRGAGLQSPQGRRSYHAAASLASNDLIALLTAAHALLVRRGVPARAALRALGTLAEGALAEVRRAGLSGALTGPVARNDGRTLQVQLRSLRALDPAAEAAHRALSLRLIDLAKSSGRLDGSQARALRLLLTRGRNRETTI
jgi:predicted short-subunit dehydrogenase-like oxidoreductase (DUF2520 family)